MPGGQHHSPTAVLDHHTYLIVDATIVVLLLLLYKLQLQTTVQQGPTPTFGVWVIFWV